MSDGTISGLMKRALAYLLAAIIWAALSMVVPAAGIAINALAAAGVIWLLRSTAVSATLWRLVGKPPPPKAPIVRGVAAILAFTLAGALSIAALVDEAKKGDAQARMTEAQAGAEAREAEARRVQHQQALEEARKAAAAGDTEAVAVAYTKAEAAGSLPAPDATAYAKLLLAKGEKLSAEGHLEDAIKTLEHANRLQPKLDGVEPALAAAAKRHEAEKATRAAEATAKQRQEAAKRFKTAAQCARENIAAIKGYIKAGNSAAVVVASRAGLDCATSADAAQPGDATAAKLKAELDDLHSKAHDSDWKRIAKQIIREAGYITNVGSGPSGDHAIEVTVSQAWHYKPKTVKEEQILLIAQRFAHHVQVFHPDQSPRVEILDQSGREIGGTTMFGGAKAD